MPAESKVNRGPSAGPENRQALIDAARAVFREEGFAAPLSSVARRAGVGQGSLYRHFPDRVSLAVAVFDDNIADLETFADHPESTLDGLFDRIAEQAIGSTALIDLLTSHPHDRRAEHLGTRVNAVLGLLLARDQKLGRVSDRVVADDVMLAVSMMAFAVARSDPSDRATAAERARSLFRAAFRPEQE